MALGLAIPSLDAIRQRAKLYGAAAQLETDVQFARSESVSRNRAIRMTLHESSSGTCYMVPNGARQRPAVAAASRTLAAPQAGKC